MAKKTLSLPAPASADQPNKLTREYVDIDPEVEWCVAEEAIGNLQRMLSGELAHLAANEAIRNAYGPIAWLRLCRTVSHVIEGMAVVRLASAGATNDQIKEATRVDPLRIAAFKAVNTKWCKQLKRRIDIRWRREEERQREMEFLRSIGVLVREDSDGR